jgi:DNA-binding transcriptional LysR family regulator
MRPTWNQLRIFEAVARNASFTRAAQELNVVQPTVSAQIKQLAESVGLPLFEQVGKKIHLTEAGHALLGTCTEVFEAWDRLEMTVADLQGLKRGRLRLAIVSTAKYFIPRLLGPFCHIHPGVDVALEISNRDGVLERLAANRDDLYIVGIPPERAAIEREPFLENPLVVIAPRNHRLAQQRRIPLARLAREPFILREPGSGTRIATDAFFGAHRFTPQVRLAVSNNEAIKWAVAGGLGVAVLSQHALLLEPMHRHLVVLDVEGFPILRDWYVAYPSGKQLSVVARAFLAHLRAEAPAIRKELALPKRLRRARLTVPAASAPR